jgi:flavodoxin/ferredoxin
MNSVVIYYSITGNTKKIAEAIQAGMKKASQPGEKSDIARLRDVYTPDLADYDLIGLGAPLMWTKPPPFVPNFIDKTMTNVDGKHGFAFCTHGAMKGFYFQTVVPAMTQRGLTVIGWNDWFGGVYFPCVPKPYFTDGHPDAVDLKEAEDFGREMVERSRRIYQGETQLIPKFPKGKEYDEIYNPFLSRGTVKSAQDYPKILHKALSVKFEVNKEKCKYPACTFCIDNCPMHAIDLSVDPPLFDMDCCKCFLCEMACPEAAIDFDYGPFQKIHNVTRDDDSLGLQASLEFFEARGEFRRLTPMDKIGWGTNVWQLKKPRYKIA